MRTIKLLPLLLLGGLGVIGACSNSGQTSPLTVPLGSDSGTDSTQSMSASPCSTGPEYAWDSQIQDEAPPGTYAAYDGKTKNPPTCTAHCGTTQYGPNYIAYPYEALPTGPCAMENELCSMRARPTCPCPNDVTFGSGTGGANTFYCRCGGGAWRCSIFNANGVSAQPCTLLPPACGASPADAASSD